MFLPQLHSHQNHKPKTMSSNHFILSSILLLYNLLQTQSQQPYVNNHQLNCPINHPTTLGFTCNSPTPSCQSYLTFRTTPTYNSPVSISYLLSSNPTQIAALNNISTVDPLPIDTLLIIPVNCSCTPLRTYYQHNSSYVLQHSGETYFTVANNTYQSLSTCQSMEAQNSYGIRDLVPNLTLNVPLRCACPTENQTAAGFNYLLTYLVRQGNTVTYIADYFSGAGATVQGILDANELNETQLIYFFTPLLVPLTREPVIETIHIGALPPVVSPPPPTAPDTPNGDGSSRRWIFVGVGVGVGVLVLFSCGVLVCIVLRKRRKGKRIPPTPPKVFNSGKKEKEDMSVEVPISDWSISSEGIRSAVETLTLYKFEELEKATDWFSEGNRIGESAVYVGTFNGDYAAVKIMKGDVSREIDVLRQINHLHIVRLSGFCLHQGVTYLVYEYAKNGALADWLSLSGSSKGKGFGVVRGDRGLDWKERVQIAYDVADALNYLHNFANPPYIHKNLKSSNVLLDSNLRAKVSNFGLARSLENEDEEQGGALTRHVVGTYGYMAPEYIENGLVTPKLDVFALGVVILELLSGKEAVMSEKGGELLFESIEGVMSGENVREKFRQFVDPWLGEDYPLELAYSLAELAKRCVAHDLNARPSVSEVVMALSRLLSSSLDWDPSHEQRSTSFSHSGR